MATSNLKITLPILVGVLLLTGLAGYFLARQTNDQIVINRREEVVIDEGINNTQVINQTKASLVMIYADRRLAATGVIATSDGIVVVPIPSVSLPGQVKLTAVMPDGMLVLAQFLASDESRGLAFLQIQEQNLPVARQGFAKEVPVGEHVLVVQPSTIPKSVQATRALVSLPAYPVPSLTKVYGLAKPNVYLGLDPAPGGDKLGAVVVNRAGNLIGFVTQIGKEVKVLTAEDYKFAIDKFLNHTPYLSFKTSYGILSESLAELYGLPKNYGVLIKTAGGILRPGDFVIAVDGKPLSEKNDFQKILSEKKVGDRVKIKFIRAGDEMEAEIIL